LIASVTASPGRGGAARLEWDELVDSGRSVALSGCLLPGSGGHPWPHSPPQAIHGLLSATPRQDAASAIHWRGAVRATLIKPLQPVIPAFTGMTALFSVAFGFPSTSEVFRWRLSGVLVTK
jgi:hypothetical protein